jgi:ferredoxin-NADP reductase
MYLVDDVAAFLAGKPSLEVTIPARRIPDGVVAGVRDPTGKHPVYLCGPPGLAAAVRRALPQAGLPKEQLHGERFDFSMRPCLVRLTSPDVGTPIATSKGQAASDRHDERPSCGR